ncbi:tetratricopeptide repeat protein [Paludifilum halophilum]|uniref:Tetratricopeptide repeat protein n=1 Tax=Paludifilum halophilum TaxID=1642702 RepID=A0A235B1K1_9BACL|nr:tetratricopeptide repeat protein [Paludifilum halophilum]OYD06154.1 hypothetical protein CHM34_17805 [Paludifilum halophilum]
MGTDKPIPLFDEWGHLIWMDREEFRNSVIPENIQAEWDHSDRLYAFVVQIYRDGFLKEAEQGADRLLELSDRSEEALLLKGLILLRQKRFEEAEAVLRECIESYSDRGVAHTYLARLYSRRSEDEKVVATLEEGLIREPNQETALHMLTRWSPKEKAIRFLQKMTKNSEAWGPHLALGKLYLEDNRMAEALEQFRSALDQSRRLRGEEGLPQWEEEVTAMTVFALLHKRDEWEELIRLGESYWTPAFLTPFPGMDYAEALEKEGRVEEAVHVLEETLSSVEPEYRQMVQLRRHRLAEKKVQA